MGDDVDEGGDRFLNFAERQRPCRQRGRSAVRTWFRVILQEEIQVKDVKDVQGVLALIQVDALDLHFQERTRPHVRIIAVADVMV